MKKLIPCLMVLFLGSYVYGQNNLPSNFYMTTLENGLEVLTVEDPSVPLATIEIAVHNGAYTETPDFDGLSHLYEHMFFKANRDIPSQEQFMDRVNELGIAFNGTTSAERVNYFVTLSNTKTEEGLKFMNSAIRYPLFLEQEMKNENPVVDGEFQRAESNPVFFLQQDMSRHMWGDLYSRKNTIGDHDIILTATPEKMREIQSRYYYPNNSILVVAGDVDHEEVEKMAKDIFGDWKASDFEIFEEYPIPEFEPLEESKAFITVNENTQVPIMMINQMGPDTRGDIEATYAADVFSYILGQQGSKFQTNLVQSGLAYNAGVSYQTLKHVGPIVFFLVPNPQKYTEAVAQLETEIANWTSDDYFTDEQLETAKNLLAIQEEYSRESTSDFVHSLTYWWASASIDYYTSYIDNIKKVSRADIQDFVKEYIIGQPNVTGLLVSPMMQEMLSLEKIEPVKI